MARFHAHVLTPLFRGVPFPGKRSFKKNRSCKEFFFPAKRDCTKDKQAHLVKHAPLKDAPEMLVTLVDWPVLKCLVVDAIDDRDCHRGVVPVRGENCFDSKKSRWWKGWLASAKLKKIKRELSNLGAALLPWLPTSIDPKTRLAPKTNKPKYQKLTLNWTTCGAHKVYKKRKWGISLAFCGHYMQFVSSCFVLMTMWC